VRPHLIPESKTDVTQRLGKRYSVKKPTDVDLVL